LSDIFAFIAGYKERHYRCASYRGASA